MEMGTPAVNPAVVTISEVENHYQSESGQCQNNEIWKCQSNSVARQSQSQSQPGHHCHCFNQHRFHRPHHPHQLGRTCSPERHIEIDWREVDPYFSELSDCASFWVLINFTCDVIYSGLFVLFFIMGQDVESMFFEGLLNHINPILIYLILSLIINYGALRSLRCRKERCFLVFSVMKALLFPVTLSLLIYLVFCDVQEYFGTFWVSFVAIVGCYNGTAALGLWSMFTCNKYILVNEAAQKRIRKEAKHQIQVSAPRTRNQSDATTTNYNCNCGSSQLFSSLDSAPPSATRVLTYTPAHASSSAYQTSNQVISSIITPSRSNKPRSSYSRKVGDSSCAKNLILVCKPDIVTLTSPSSSRNYFHTNCSDNNKHKCNNGNIQSCCASVSTPFTASGVIVDPCTSSSIPLSKSKEQLRGSTAFDGDGDVLSSIINFDLEDDDDDEDFEDVMSFGYEDDGDDEVLQISTVHKVMQEIKMLDSKGENVPKSDKLGPK